MRETRHLCIKPDKDSTLLQYAVELIELVGPALQDIEMNNPGVDIMREIISKGLVICIKPFKCESSSFSDCCRGNEDKQCNDKQCDSSEHDEYDDTDDNSLGMSFEEFKNRIDAIINRITGDSRKSSAQ